MLRHPDGNRNRLDDRERVIDICGGEEGALKSKPAGVGRKGTNKYVLLILFLYSPAHHLDIVRLVAHFSQ